MAPRTMIHNHSGTTSPGSVNPPRPTTVLLLYLFLFDLGVHAFSPNKYYNKEGHKVVLTMTQMTMMMT